MRGSLHHSKFQASSLLAFVVLTTAPSFAESGTGEAAIMAWGAAATAAGVTAINAGKEIAVKNIEAQVRKDNAQEKLDSQLLNNSFQKAMATMYSQAEVSNVLKDNALKLRLYMADYAERAAARADKRAREQQQLANEASASLTSYNLQLQNLRENFQNTLKRIALLRLQKGNGYYVPVTTSTPVASQAAPPVASVATLSMPTVGSSLLGQGLTSSNTETRVLLPARASQGLVATLSRGGAAGSTPDHLVRTDLGDFNAVVGARSIASQSAGLIPHAAQALTDVTQGLVQAHRHQPEF